MLTHFVGGPSDRSRRTLIRAMKYPGESPSEGEGRAVTATISTEEAAPTRDWRRLAARILLGFVGFLLLGNGLIMASMAWYRITHPGETVEGVAIDNFRRVDERIYRGAAPGETDYADLADLGVTTVVDLRAEAAGVEDEFAAAAGLERVHLPIRDGQIPTADQVAEVLAIVERADGAVFLHCGAGVGRTGAMTAAYLNLSGRAGGAEALKRNLAVGPPSLEQIAFSLETNDGQYDRPGPVTTVVSRVLDGPRRIWHNVT